MKVTGYTAGGLATGGVSGMSLSVKNGSKVGNVNRRTSGQMKKKQLNYNPREISSAILRASKSQAAGRVMVMAKSKLTNLQKCKGTGQYNEGELDMAIAHAKRMVRCAQLKTQNLRQEERERKRYEREAKEELRQEKNKLKSKAARKERDLEQKCSLERMQRIQKEKSERRDFVRKKKMHRSHERSKVNEADMEYLKQQVRGMREPYTANNRGMSCVTLDLSAQAMQLSEAQMEAQIAQEMAAMEAGMDGAEGISGETVGAETAGAAAAAPISSLNITI